MYLINGLEVTKEEFTLPVENLAVWRGDGVFEALKIHDHYHFGLEKHIDLSLIHISEPTRRS